MNDEKLASAGASSVISSVILGLVGYVGNSQAVLAAALVFLIGGIFLIGIFSDDGPTTEYPPEDEGRYE